MVTDPASLPVATVTGLYRGKFAGIEPLTVDTPLTAEEVRRNPIFYELDLHPEQGDENRIGQSNENLTGLGGENLIIDVIYDNLSPMRLQDLRRGTDIPRGVRFWLDWFDIPHYEEMHDIDGRRVYPRALGVHTVQIRTGRRKFAQMGRIRDFSPEHGGYTSPAFEIRIAGDRNAWNAD
ncbi:MAG: hypothetical protein NTV84_09060 [Methanoregula sp.]|nr:hypothetical protein [Methanoregula sp.]